MLGTQARGRLIQFPEADTFLNIHIDYLHILDFHYPSMAELMSTVFPQLQQKKTVWF